MDFNPSEELPSLQGSIEVRGEKVLAVFHTFGQIEGTRIQFLVHIRTARFLSLKWKDRFRVRRERRREVLGKGRVLNPQCSKNPPKNPGKRMAFLQSLLTEDEGEMLLAIAQDKGIQGIKEEEIVRFSQLPRESLESLSQDLEAEGRVRVLSFSPLMFMTQTSFDFLCEEILALLSRFHQNHPAERGMPREQIQRRFKLPQRILSLAVRYLSQEGKLRELNEMLALSEFKMSLNPEEEKILVNLEEMCRKGEFHSVSFEELKRNFGMSAASLNRMISLLVERKKVVLGNEGLILHSYWLRELIKKIRLSGRKELTVADFKEMTGLSRRFAIPLLELLDQMGVTQRRGSVRLIVSKKEIKHHAKKNL